MLPVLAVGGLLVAAAAAMMPAVAYLRRPDVVSLVAGLVVLGVGLVMVASEAPAGWLTFLAGITWFLPDLGATGVEPVDRALLAAALVHVAVLTHAAMVVPGQRIVSAARRLAVACGYAAAVSGVVGGDRILLPLAGVSLLKSRA